MPACRLGGDSGCESLDIECFEVRFVKLVKAGTESFKGDRGGVVEVAEIDIGADQHFGAGAPTSLASGIVVPTMCKRLHALLVDSAIESGYVDAARALFVVPQAHVAHCWSAASDDQ
jgi:hypothetical protein